MYTNYETHLNVEKMNEGLFDFFKKAFNKLKEYSKKIENAPKVDKEVNKYKTVMTDLFNKKIEINKQLIVKEVEYEKAKNNPDLKKSYDVAKTTVTKQLLAISKLIEAQKTKFENIVNNLATTAELKKYLETKRAALNVELTQMELTAYEKFGQTTTTKNLTKSLKLAGENVTKLQSELDNLVNKQNSETESVDFSTLKVGDEFEYTNSKDVVVKVKIEKLDTELTEESAIENEPNKAVENKGITELGDKWIQVKSDKGGVFHVQKKNLKAIEKPAEETAEETTQPVPTGKPAATTTAAA